MDEPNTDYSGASEKLVCQDDTEESMYASNEDGQCAASKEGSPLMDGLVACAIPGEEISHEVPNADPTTLDQTASSNLSEEFQQLMMLPQKGNNEINCSQRKGEIQDGGVMLKVKNVTNCPGAVVAEEVHQNIHKEKHVHVQSTSLSAMIEDTRKSMDNMSKSHVETRATKKALEILRRKFKVMITGMTKQGKTTMSFYLARILSEDKNNPFTPVELLYPDHWTHLDPNQNYIVILDDLLGNDADDIDYQWSKVLKQILNRVDRGNVILIMTSADDVLRKCKQNRIGTDVFDRSILVSLSSDEFRLRKFEKVHILEKLFQNVGVKCSRKELAEASSESLDDQFFECCDYFTAHFRNLHVGFFKHPFQMVLGRMSNIHATNKLQFFALLKVALNSIKPMMLVNLPHSVAEEIRKVDLNMHDGNPCPEFLSLIDGHLQFKHLSLHICALLALADIDLSLMVKVCPVDILINHTTTRDNSRRNEGKIILGQDLYQQLSDRLEENLDRDLKSTLRHDCFSDKRFLLSVNLMDKLKLADPVSVLRNAIHCEHTQLVQMFLEDVNLDQVHLETKHELLHEAFDSMNIDVCHQFFILGERVCDLCFLRMCSSDKKSAHLQLDALFAADTLESISVEVLERSLEELFNHGQTTIIEQLTALILKRDDFLETKDMLIYAACKHGQKDIYWLLKETAAPFPRLDSLLSYAAEGGCLDIVNDLLMLGGNPNMKTHRIFKPIHLACKNNHLEVTKRLLSAGAEITDLTSSKENVLHLCSYVKPGTKPETLCWLLKNYLGMIEIESKNIKGCTPLHIAASVGNIASIKLLTDFGAHVSSHDIDGNTPLHCHVMGENSNPQTLEHLLKAGADLDARNDNGETPIQILIQQNTRDRCRVLQYIVSKTREVSSLYSNGSTGLHALLANGCNSEEAEIMIEGGSDVNAQDGNGNTVLHFLASLGDSNLVNLVLKKGANMLARNRHDQTPLHRAVCVPSNLMIVEQLLQAPSWGENCLLSSVLYTACEKSVEGADMYVPLLLQLQPTVVQNHNPRGQTALHLASGSSGATAVKVIEILLFHKADVNSRDSQSNTPLHAASMACNTHSCGIICTLLMKDADVNCKNDNMDTPVHVACQSEGPCKADVINTLVAYGAKLTARNRDGCTPTDIALSRAELEIANALSHGIITGACFFRAYKGADVLAAWKETPSLDGDEQTVLHKVCEISQKHSKKLIQELVYCGCNINAKDLKGKTPLHIACEFSGHYSAGIVEELLSLGANVNDKDQNGNNALHFACAAKTKEAARVVQILVERKANVDERDNAGDTPLHKVCRRQGDYIYKIVQSLINCGANIDGCNFHGFTPFDLVTQSTCPPKTNQVLFSTKLWQICNGETELKESGVRYFLKQGASLDHKHVDGNTLLHKICQQTGAHSRKNAKLVLSLGADPHAKNDLDHTPYDTAIFFGNDDVAELVKEKQSTTEVKMSNFDKLKAGVDAGAECCEVLGKVYGESEQVMKKAAAAVKEEHKEFAEAMQISGELIKYATKLTSGGKKFFDFFRNFSDKD